MELWFQRTTAFSTTLAGRYGYERQKQKAGTAGIGKERRKPKKKTKQTMVLWNRCTVAVTLSVRGKNNGSGGRAGKPKRKLTDDRCFCYTEEKAAKEQFQ